MSSLLEGPRCTAHITLLRERLPEKKVQHCLSVAEYLLSFSNELGLNAESAADAGLLHDICRKMTDAELLQRAETCGITVSESQHLKPGLLHGPLAAEECRRELGLDSADLHEAIYWHTTGRPELGRLGQALYFADFAEPLRAYPEARTARTLLDTQGFDAALRYVAEKKIFFLQKRDVIDPATSAFLRWLCPELAP